MVKQSVFLILLVVLGCASQFKNPERLPAQNTPGDQLSAEYWRAVILDDYNKAMELEKQIRQSLLYATIIDRQPGYMGGNATLLIFDNGMKGLFKTAMPGEVNPSMEAHKVDLMLKFLLTPPIVMRDTIYGFGTIELLVPNAREGNIDLRQPEKAYPSDRMYVLDRLIGNVDRSAENWLIISGTHVVAIDNELNVLHKFHKAIRERGGPVAADTLRAVSMDTYDKLKAFDTALLAAHFNKEADPRLVLYAQFKVTELLEYSYRNMLITNEGPKTCRKILAK